MLVMTEARLHDSGRVTALKIDRSVSTSTKRFQHAVQRADVVSVDIFGTALVRCVFQPSDVFELVAYRLQERTGSHIGARAFRDARIRAERSVGTKNAPDRGTATLETIYASLGEELPALVLSLAMQEELNVERAVTFANSEMVALYRQLRHGEKHVVFTTDTYLPHQFLSELLGSLGYPDAHVVHAPSKSNGRLSGAASAIRTRRTLEGSDARIVHLRDDAPARYRSRPRVRRHAPHTNGAALGVNILAGLEALALAEKAGSAEEALFRSLGYRLAGPLFLGLTQWLADSVRSKPTDLVLFCARDGFFVRRVYERIGQFVQLPPSRYFEVSRRALVFPSMNELNERSLDVLCSNIAPIAAAEYFSRIGIDLSAFPDELAAVGLTPESTIYTPGERLRLRRLFERLQDSVLARARDERPLLFEYLRQSGCLDATRVAMFDIGWGGTLQEALGRAFADHRSAAQLRGYYLSTDERIAKLTSRAGTACGWFTNVARPDRRQQPVNDGYWLLELMFSGQHGTILGYRRASDGTVEAIRHTFDDTSPNAVATRCIQAAALEFVDRWTAIFAGIGPRIPMDEAFGRYRRLIQRPTEVESRYFGSLVHVGGLGATAEASPVVAIPPLAQIMRNPKALLTAYRQSDWQLVFLARILHNAAAARTLLAFRSIVRKARRAVTAKFRQR